MITPELDSNTNTHSIIVEHRDSRFILYILVALAPPNKSVIQSSRFERSSPTEMCAVIGSGKVFIEELTVCINLRNLTCGCI